MLKPIQPGLKALAWFGFFYWIFKLVVELWCYLNAYKQKFTTKIFTIIFYSSKIKPQPFYCSKKPWQRRLAMQIKLFDSELKIMDVLWKNGDTTAKQIAETLKEQVGWNKTTTYTLIKRCIDKGAIERI
ncbi:BlaI/MecI/CopY family transcriptional regulator, partial [Paenibacillus macerans]|uniref:BlaI/MecI/CopY family transcriptional regulator n=1 Tax=Paenibacillus macerans TaxID=44252 RepID=UPI003D2E25DF